MTQFSGEPLARGAAAVDSDIRRFALQHLLTKGYVSAADIRREFLDLTPSSAMHQCRVLVKLGIAEVDPTHDRKGNPKQVKGRLSEEFALRFTLKDKSSLQALHQWLSVLLEVSNG